MKLIVFAATAALTFGQAAKVEPKPEVPATPTERALSETEVLKLRLMNSQLQVLQDRYKITQFQEEVKPIATEQQNLFTSMCLSVGVPADKIQTACAVNTGYDNDGKPLTGADGKPIPAKVWYNKPQVAPMPTLVPEKK